jgi:hypothetical protein
LQPSTKIRETAVMASLQPSTKIRETAVMGLIATITKDEYKNDVFSEGILSAIPHHKKAILLNPVLCEYSSAEVCDQQCVTLRGKVPTASLLNSRCKIP